MQTIRDFMHAKQSLSHIHALGPVARWYVKRKIRKGIKKYSPYVESYLKQNGPALGAALGSYINQRLPSAAGPQPVSQPAPTRRRTPSVAGA